ncbi:MAG: hypothetical protein COB26_04225 [Piscirickettsiaceae bacterium]|nr:MAG: hypothetical protein COB26_04225 [Piscirickettsiaceae bacterium]
MLLCFILLYTLPQFNFAGQSFVDKARYFISNFMLLMPFFIHLAFISFKISLTKQTNLFYS